jgi:uncharacterized membrane protein YgcG
LWLAAHPLKHPPAKGKKIPSAKLSAQATSAAHSAPAAGASLQVPNTRVFDQKGDLTIEVLEPVMASSQAESLGENLQSFKERHKEPIAVLLMPQLHQGWERLDEYAPQIAKKWSIGQADVGAGLLVIVAFGKKGTQAVLSFSPSLFERLSQQDREQMFKDFLTDLQAAQLADGILKLITSLDLHLTKQSAQEPPPLSQ